MRKMLACKILSLKLFLIIIFMWRNITSVEDFPSILSGEVLEVKAHSEKPMNVRDLEVTDEDGY